MFVLQRIRPAVDNERGRLYFDTNLPPITSYPAALPAGSFISANSYWNSFYPAMWPSGSIPSPALYLAVSGAGQLHLYGTRQGRKTRFLSSDLDALRTSDGIAVTLPGPAPRRLGPGRLIPMPAEFDTFDRIYWQLDSKSGLEFSGGYWLANISSPAEVRAALAICTYEKEIYLNRTIRSINQDSDVRDILQVNISDNAGTYSGQHLPDFCKVVPNHNVGGAGGFARALNMGLADPSITHLAMLDDDIELDTEAIFRILSLYSVQKEGPAYAGAMLDILVKNKLYEAGAFFEGTVMRSGRLTI